MHKILIVFKFFISLVLTFIIVLPKTYSSEKSLNNFTLCKSYRLGIDVPSDREKAYKFCKIAALSGHPTAQLFMGYIYNKGEGVALNYKKAYKWFKLASDNKNPVAIYNLGLLYYYGTGVEQNIYIAKKYITRAANLNHKNAKERLKEINLLHSNKTFITSNQTKDTGQRPLAYVSDTYVCYNATSSSGGSKVWSDKNDNFVGEAKYRGLDCGVRDNKYQIQIPNDDSICLDVVRYWLEADNITIYRDRLSYWKKVISLMKEMIRRELPYCGHVSREDAENLILVLSEKGLSVSDTQVKTIITPTESKNLAKRPSISSVELEKERAKRLEEERKRRALEKEIAKLKQKNKELQHPKKKKQKPSNEIGSGFYVSKFRHIVTNQHVVNQCKKITVGDSMNTQISVDLIASDKRNDLAILQTISMELASADTKSFVQRLAIEIVPIISGGLMRTEDVRGGEEILVAGYPLGNMVSDTIKVTKGIVSAIKGMDNDVSQFEIDAVIRKGNSGGPVYDKRGNIVGVAVSRLNVNRAEYVNFGIKGSTVKQFLSAHDIPTKWSNRNKTIDSEQLYKIASKQTVMVVCHR